MAEEILGSVDEMALWGALLSSRDERIRLDSLKFLTDRRDGKAPQSVAVAVNTDVDTDALIAKILGTTK